MANLALVMLTKHSIIDVLAIALASLLVVVNGFVKLTSYEAL